MPGASGDFRSSVMLFLFRAYTFQCTLMPASRQSRSVSPVPGDSTFTTSAPKSASCRLSMLPATSREKSSTRTPRSGPSRSGSNGCLGMGIGVSSGRAVCCPDCGTIRPGRAFWPASSSGQAPGMRADDPVRAASTVTVSRATLAMTIERIPGFCALCRSRCGCVSVVEDGTLVAVEPDPSHPTGANLCVKGRAAPELVYDPDRLLYPMRRTRPKGDPDAGWQRIGWDEALDWTAARMREVAERHGAEAVAFALTTPAGTAVSDGFPWINRLVRMFGSPNLVVGRGSVRLAPRLRRPRTPSAPTSARRTSSAPAACCSGATTRRTPIWPRPPPSRR